MNLNRYGLANEWPKLRKLQEEVASLENERARAERQVMVARSHLGTAQERDAEAAAKAIRAGKGVPKASQTAKAQAAVEDAERTLAAYQKALQDAQQDAAAFEAENRAALYAALLSRLNEWAGELKGHSQAAQRLYTTLEDSRYDIQALTPPPPIEESGPPGSSSGARLTNSFIGIQTTRSMGPARGHVEQVLEFLASQEQRYALPEADQDQEEGAA